MADNNIRVVCRFRPQSSREIDENGNYIASFDDDMTTVKCDSKEYPGTFSFDKIFDWRATQKDVFAYSANSTVNDIMNGYNGTIFAYGQTGSGKTHTMMGNMELEDLKGLTPRIVEKIFDTILSSPSNLEFTVRVSYMEIYMEKIRDLLNPSNDNLPIHEDKLHGVYVKGLIEPFVSSIDEVFDAMYRGQKSRVVGYTNMNAESSRSHSIFVIQITQKNLDTGSTKVGKLSLVDLAGSEKVGKTGATGQTLEEAKKINKSLSALGMVINALTDGKSSHVPYRDSKLTRILQESLGGNSRTTLIINCSPSSFNEAETISTLRFGMRAKTIKNKAKINAEISPSELKSLLRSAKCDIVVLQGQIKGIQSELLRWRTGQTVPEEEWVKLLSETSMGAGIAAVAPAAEGDTAQQNIPSRPGSAERSVSPLADDEREEFLRRENELTDQLTQKEKELQRQTELVTSIQEELDFLKQREAELMEENKAVTDLKLKLEKVNLERDENLIMIDSLKESRNEAMNEIAMLKRQNLELHAAKTPESHEEDEKERKRQEKMAQMMAEYASTDDLNDKERQIRETLGKLTLMHETTQPPTTPEDIELQHIELLDTKAQLAQRETHIAELESKVAFTEEELSALRVRHDDLGSKLATLESEYEQLLEKTIQEEDQHFGGEISSVMQDLKAKLEQQYNVKRDMQDMEMADLHTAVMHKDEEIAHLQKQLAEQSDANAELRTAADVASSISGTIDPSAMNIGASPGDQTGPMIAAAEEIEAMRKTMAQQLLEFDGMKKKLMRDLQNRCERVVELEISLDEAREQYSSILRNTNSRTQQQKMAFLERNLEQLTNVQRQLVDQNATLKKDLAVAERKLVTRNERIQNLEMLLQDSQVKVEMQTQKYEAELSRVHERLRQVQMQQQQQQANFGSNWVQSSRIAKPLRGGGGGTGLGGHAETGARNTIGVSGNVVHYAGEEVDVATGLPDITTALTTPNSKRSSWYISLLKK